MCRRKREWICSTKKNLREIIHAFKGRAMSFIVPELTAFVDNLEDEMVRLDIHDRRVIDELVQYVNAQAAAAV